MEQIKIVDARTSAVYGAISADFRLPAVRGSATAAETSFIPHDRIHYRHAPRPDCPAIPPPFGNY